MDTTEGGTGGKGQGEENMIESVFVRSQVILHRLSWIPLELSFAIFEFAVHVSVPDTYFFLLAQSLPHTFDTSAI